MGEPPQIFGKYQLIARLAKGGMAQTWRARMMADAGVTKDVVIKKVLPSYAEDEAFITAFVNEAKISASLSHGNIAQVFDFGRVEGDYFIAMEWIEGRSLLEMITRAAESGFKRIPVTLACFLAIEVLKGLHYAHTRTADDGTPLRIVHRDVTPENILIGFEGQTKVVDFGVAKAVLHGRRETEPGLVKGKFLFFSPEQSLAGPLDGRSDVFAVGVVLYQLLCGELPFSGQMHKVMNDIVRGAFRPAAQVNPALPSTLAAVLAKAMETDRERRYESALRMQEALSSFLYRQDPSFSGETVKEWMLWLFRDELAAAGRPVSLSSRFLEQLDAWRGIEAGDTRPTQAHVAPTRPALATPFHSVLKPEAPTVAEPPPPPAQPARWPWALGGLGMAIGVVVAGLALAPPDAPVLPPPGPQPLAPLKATPAAGGALAPAAELSAAQREKLIVDATLAIGALDWEMARTLLTSATVGGAICPAAARLLEQMEAERPNKEALVAAEEALDAHNLIRAKPALARAAKTRLLAERYRTLNARFTLEQRRLDSQPPTPEPAQGASGPTKQAIPGMRGTGVKSEQDVNKMMRQYRTPR